MEHALPKQNLLTSPNFKRNMQVSKSSCFCCRDVNVGAVRKSCRTGSIFAKCFCNAWQALGMTTEGAMSSTMGKFNLFAPSSLPHSPRPQVWCPFPGHHRWRDLRRIVQGEADGRWKIMEGNFLCKNTERSKLKVHHLISFDFISFGVLLQLKKTRLKA